MVEYFIEKYGRVTFDRMEVLVLARIKSDLIQQDKLEKMVVVLKAVAHPMRLQIVNILMNGEKSVGNLVKYWEQNNH